MCFGACDFRQAVGSANLFLDDSTFAGGRMVLPIWRIRMRECTGSQLLVHDFPRVHISQQLCPGLGPEN